MRHGDEEFILNNIKKKSVDEIAKELGVKKRKIERFLEARKIKLARPLSIAAINTPKIKFSILGIFLVSLLIIFLGIVTYANSVNGQFIWDDHGWIKNNEHIKDLSNPAKFFSGAMSSDKNFVTRMYRPIQLISYAIEHSLWGLDVKGYHMTNMVLHILVALSIFLLIGIISKDIILSSVAGILFVVHPVHAETVSYISGRSDSLGAVFLLAALILYIFNLKNSGARSVLVSAAIYLSYALALLSREASAILIILILFYHWIFKEKINFRDAAALSVMTAVYAILRPNTFNEVINTTVLQRLPGFFAAFCGYIKLFFLPFDLHMEYGNKLFIFSDGIVFLGMLEFALLVVLIFMLKNSNKLIAFFLGWFVIALTPVSNLYPLNAYMAEHWLYLPSIGLFAGFAWVISRAFGFKDFRMFAAISLFAIVISYASLTMKQNSYWKDPESFFERNLKYSDYKPRLYNELGIVYYEKGEVRKAIEAFEEGLRLDPRNRQIQDNLKKITGGRGGF